MNGTDNSDRGLTAITCGWNLSLAALLVGAATR